MSKDNKDEKNSLNKLEELLLKSRTVMLYGEINQKVARECCSKLQQQHRHHPHTCADFQQVCGLTHIDLFGLRK